LILPTRNPANGYRQYSEYDLNQLILLRQLQKAGLTLQECQGIMQGKLDEDVIEQRLLGLEQELKEMQMARDVLYALYGKATGHPIDSRDFRKRLQDWHSQFEKRSSDAHLHWLRQLGFSEKDAIHVRCVSRDILDNGGYMEDFFTVFEKMQRLGPGSAESTLRAFKAIPDKINIESILDVGCGKGAASLALASACHAKITAVDNHTPFLECLKNEVARLGLVDRIEAVNTSMFELPYPDASFDLLWAEGSAYIMGFEKALCEWKRLLRDGGYLFVSDAVLLTDQPSPECAEFWGTEYPGMSTPEERLQLAQELGYRVLDSFTLPRKDWQAFYDDMLKQVDAAIETRGTRQAFIDIKEEIRIANLYGDEFSYVCLLLQKA
jgi:ubiquinone/menaquinone biosynthesis C-methylase UbiE/DNA-binding transcriptional MerR regulator